MPGESLKVTSGPAAGKTIEVTGDLVLGRSVEGPGGFEDDPELSRRHAQIPRESEDYLSLKDLGSRNGTFLNGTRLTGVQVLQPGDTIRIGTTNLTVDSRRADQPTLAAGGQETVRARAVVTPPAAEVAAPGAAAVPPQAVPSPPAAPAAPQVQPFPPLPGAARGTVAVTAARAGFGRRMGALLVDYVLLYVGVSVLILVPFFAIADPSDAALTALNLVGWLSLLIYPAYYIALEGSSKGQTLGKRALGIRVVGRESGTSIGRWAATGRYFARILSALPLFLGYLWMLWDDEKQTWHDKLSGSVVVPAASQAASMP